MKRIKSADHLATLIGSINKMFFIAKTKGIIRNKELYLVNLIFKIINNKTFEFLSESDRMKLVTLYYRILNKYSFLCKTELTRDYYFESRTINITYTPDECNIYPVYNKIFYWQEDGISILLGEIQPQVDQTGYLDDKSFDTIENFINGVEINYSKIGRICFLIMESETVNIEVKDIYNNNISDAFDIVLIPDINSTLLVSKNFYSHGNINFKIKKL